MWAVAKVVLTAVLVARVADGSYVLLESDEETEMKPRSRAVGGMHSGGKYLESRRRLSPSCLGVSPIGGKKTLRSAGNRYSLRAYRRSEGCREGSGGSL